MTGSFTREQALELMRDYTSSEGLRRHMYAVEIAMRACARQIRMRTKRPGA